MTGPAAFLPAGFRDADRGGGTLLLTATLAAFAGAFAGRYLLEKTTLRGIRILIGALMLLTGALVAAGII